MHCDLTVKLRKEQKDYSAAGSALIPQLGHIRPKCHDEFSGAQSIKYILVLSRRVSRRLAGITECSAWTKEG